MRIKLLLIVGILLAAGILYAILPLNSSVASASETSYSSTAVDLSMQDQVMNENAASDAKIKNKVINKKLLNDERKAAAKRIKEALEAAGIGTLAVPAGMDPGGLPHYYGPYPNYANSPMPTFPMVATPTSFGNPLIGRGTPTDNVANVFVVNTVLLSNGTLTAIQTYNMPASGPNTFNAYVLRPTPGIPNNYTVIFDSGQLTVPSVATGQIQTFTLTTPFTVQAGDLIAHYGQGIPIDIGLGSGLDTVFYPADTMPMNGTTIDVALGDATFPLCTVCGDRTYSIAATVIVDTTFGNPLIGRATSTDNVPNVFVVNTQAPLSNGILTAFQTYNQPGSGPSTFNAYVLRPSGVPGQYSVIFDSGPLNLPSVTIGQIQTFAVGPIDVQTGDLIAHYGQGIPIDIVLGTGLDTVFYPADTMPAIGTMINVNAGSLAFPLCGTVCSDRTYSIAAIVNLGVPTVTGGIRKFVSSPK